MLIQARLNLIGKICAQGIGDLSGPSERVIRLVSFYDFLRSRNDAARAAIRRLMPSRFRFLAPLYAHLGLAWKFVVLRETDCGKQKNED